VYYESIEIFVQL